MLMVKENHGGASRNKHSDNQMLYTEADRPCGRGERGGSACIGDGRQEQNQRHNRHADSSSRSSTSRGNQGGAVNQQDKAAIDCWYYGLKGDKESKCWKKKADSDESGSTSRVEQGNQQRSHYVKG